MAKLQPTGHGPGLSLGAEGLVSRNEDQKTCHLQMGWAAGSVIC